SEIDPNTELAGSMRSVLDEAVTRGEFSSWPPLPGQRPDQLLAHQALSRGRSVMSVPLVTSEGEKIGALGVITARDNSIFNAMPGMIQALSEPLGEALHITRRNERGWLSRSTRSLFKRKSLARTLGAVVGALSLLVLLTCSLTHRVRGQVVIEPVERRFCVAPYDGLLETTFVEPGTEVRAGQSLARMDGRELHWELAGVEAERERAEKKRESHVANYETSQALMADLEVRTLANRQSLLEFNQSRLEMVSAIDGIVLSGSLDRRENYPVSKGQVVYEIAPLETLQVEVGVPAEDIQHIKVGEPIELYLDGFGTEPIRTVVERIRPRAEVRDDDNVFVIESKIENPGHVVRPGMKGTAKIDCESRSVGWILFHRAAERFRASMPF
ncbi:MAG: HlyD family efflux transporter periplasmic adaptor subunit, partial [Planctomycetota bacterium]